MAGLGFKIKECVVPEPIGLDIQPAIYLENELATPHSLAGLKISSLRTHDRAFSLAAVNSVYSYYLFFPSSLEDHNSRFEIFRLMSLKRLIQ